MPADRIDCPRGTLHLPAVGKFVHAVPTIAFVVYLHAVGCVLLWLWQGGRTACTAFAMLESSRPLDTRVSMYSRS